MKSLFLALMAACSLQAAIVHVQSLSTSGGSATTLSQAITVAAGSTILVGCASTGGATLTNVTDGTNTYTTDKAQAPNFTTGAYLARASNVSSGTYTVVCNWSGSNHSAMTVSEYTGMQNSSQPRATNGAGSFDNSGTTADGGSVTGTGGTVGSAWGVSPHPGQWATAIVAYKATSGNDLFISLTSDDNNSNTTFTAPTSMTLRTQVTTGGAHTTIAVADYVPPAPLGSGVPIVM